MKLARKQFKSKNVKGVISLLTGNSIARIVTTIGGVFLANYYGAENYGVYNVFLSYVFILSILSTFRVDSIMVLIQDTRQIRNLFSAALIIALIMNIALITFIGISQILNLFHFDLSFYLLLLIGVGSVLTAWNLSQFFLFTKYKFFKQISFSFIVAAATSVGFQALFYCLGWKENGLIFGWMVGLIASFLYNARVTKGKVQKVNLPLLKKSIIENQKIVKFTYPSDSLNAIANNIMPILIIAYFTKAEVGVYTMAFKILSTPLVVLASAVGGVFYQRSAALYNYKDYAGLKKLTQKVILGNTGLMIVFVVLMNTIGIFILEWFFTAGWEDLRSYLLALSFWIIARSVWGSTSDLDAVIRKNHYSLLFNIYLLLVNFIGIFVGIQLDNFLYSVWVFSILSGIGYIGLTGFVYYQLGKLQ